MMYRLVRAIGPLAEVVLMKFAPITVDSCRMTASAGPMWNFTTDKSNQYTWPTRRHREVGLSVGPGPCLLWRA